MNADVRLLQDPVEEARTGRTHPSLSGILRPWRRVLHATKQGLQPKRWQAGGTWETASW